jgi:Bacterial SH3 domain
MVAKNVLIVIFILTSVRALKATEDGCAVVLKTPDGFLNLRKAPTAQSEVIAKLKQGDFLYVDTARCETRGDLSICDKSDRPQWTHVTSVRRIDGKNLETPTRGWVSDQYVQWFHCEDD